MSREHDAAWETRAPWETGEPWERAVYLCLEKSEEKKTNEETVLVSKATKDMKCNLEWK